jgi:AraC-like DNA-binding protein
LIGVRVPDTARRKRRDSSGSCPPQQAFFQIAQILRKIHESYNNDFAMEELAKELDMYCSAFHNSFTAVADTSPEQYIKVPSLRVPNG